MSSFFTVLNITNANVTVIVFDMDKAIKFYTETLGLKLISRSATGFDFAVIEAPGLTLGLNPLLTLLLRVITRNMLIST